MSDQGAVPQAANDPLRYDADGKVVGSHLDEAQIAPHVVAEALTTGDSPTLDLYLNPPAPVDLTPEQLAIQQAQKASGDGQRMASTGEMVAVTAEPSFTLDIERPPENRRLLPDAFYSKRARPIRITEITAEQVILFLEQLEELGLWEMAAARAGLNKRIVDKIRKFDADFNEACNRAMAAYVDATEKKIVGRAVDGWDEPQWSHKTGMQLGTVRKFDSRLAELVLKRINPAYREKFEGEVKVTGGVMVVPGRASSVDDFMKLQQMDVVDGEVISPTGESDKAPAQIPVDKKPNV